MFCPKCRSEFREGFTRCEKCGVELVDRLPEKPGGRKEISSGGLRINGKLPPVELVGVRFAPSRTEAEMIMDILRQNNIPCFGQPREAGAFTTVYMGYSVYGEDIYVDRKNVGAALELLADWDMNKGTGEGAAEEEPYVNTSSFKRRNMAARTFALIFSVVSVLSLLYATVDALINLLKR